MLGQVDSDLPLLFWIAGWRASPPAPQPKKELLCLEFALF
jgi:hypothetical protein